MDSNHAVELRKLGSGSTYSACTNSAPNCTCCRADGDSSGFDVHADRCASGCCANHTDDAATNNADQHAARHGYRSADAHYDSGGGPRDTGNESDDKSARNIGTGHTNNNLGSYRIDSCRGCTMRTSRVCGDRRDGEFSAQQWKRVECQYPER